MCTLIFAYIFLLFNLLFPFESVSLTLNFLLQQNFFFNKLIYLFLFLAALGVCCSTWAFSSWGEWGLFFVAVCGLLIAVASLVVEQGL